MIHEIEILYPSLFYCFIVYFPTKVKFSTVKDYVNRNFYSIILDSALSPLPYYWISITFFLVHVSPGYRCTWQSVEAQCKIVWSTIDNRRCGAWCEAQPEFQTATENARDDHKSLPLGRVSKRSAR